MSQSGRFLGVQLRSQNKWKWTIIHLDSQKFDRQFTTGTVYFPSNKLPWIVHRESSTLTLTRYQKGLVWAQFSKNEERAAACQATRRAFWIIGGVGTAIFVFGTIGIYICKLGLPAKCVYICKTYGQSDPSLINGSFFQNIHFENPFF